MTEPSAGTTGSDIPVLRFAAPMPGFPGHHDFLLVSIGEQDVLFSLTSIQDTELRFLVMPPGSFFPDYAPEVDDETLDLLGSHHPEDLLVFLVVTPGGSAREATANLLAPIIVNQRRRVAVQAILSGSGLPVRAPLMATV
jgi:flagellar assembly factor FliW